MRWIKLSLLLMPIPVVYSHVSVCFSMMTAMKIFADASNRHLMKVLRCISNTMH